MDERDLPVVVVGAGPVGLAAAAHLLERGIEPLVLEAGATAGASVRQWHSVRLFSRWAEVVDPTAEKLLAPTGWQSPDPDSYATGAEWAQRYLQPLADVLGDRVRYGSRVIGVARRGRDRIVDAGRDTEPLTVHVDTADGEQRILARGLIDASGTRSTPNPLGADGLPAIGEKAAADRIAYQVPDFADPDVRARYAGKRIAVAGSGHSALTALVAFADLARDEPGTHVDWLLRRGQVGDTFGGGDADQLPPRGALGLRAAAAVEAGHITTVTGFRTVAVAPVGQGPGAGVPGRAPPRPGRRGGGADRVPPGPVVALGGAPGPRPHAAGRPRAGTVDRPERALLRHGVPARRP
jgi:Dehydrogenases (flavoproteins)